MSYLATRQRPSASAPTDGSRTITLHDAQPLEGDHARDGSGGETVGELRLRGAAGNRPRVVWSDDVVDNEGAGKKSSKICCIYHKPKKFDESSSEEDSDDSESDSDARGHGRGHAHDHSHRRRTVHRGRPIHRPTPDTSGDDMQTHSSSDGGPVHGVQTDSDDANVYERVPGRKAKGKAVARN
ncbi:phosphatase inhibitor-domain-containing protein [Amylocystis lapponica]|nr:phosphatase inhibitor-domain-containing protein [Amylocystis lapponica]